MNGSPITTVARRIARAHNASLSRAARAHNASLSRAHSGGLLAFDAAGLVLEWCSASSRPDAAIVFPCRSRRVTCREVQAFLNERARS